MITKYLPVGMKFRMQRDAHTPLTGIRHVGDGRFDVSIELFDANVFERTGINVHHLLNFYDKYFVTGTVPHGDKYPLRILFVDEGYYKGQSLEAVLMEAQFAFLPSVMYKL